MPGLRWIDTASPRRLAIPGRPPGATPGRPRIRVAVGQCRLANARRFAAHLTGEYAAVFSFLFDPTLDATNWRAAHALRPAVGTRTMCGGGNRTPRGAHTHQVLASVLRTAQQRGLDSTGVLVAARQAPRPVVLDAFQPMLH